MNRRQFLASAAVSTLGATSPGATEWSKPLKVIIPPLGRDELPERYRDGKKAVESAARACELGQWKDAEPISTLAAAYAEASDFAKAVEFQEKAIKLYKKTADQKQGKERLKLYRQKKPYRYTGE